MDEEKKTLVTETPEVTKEEVKEVSKEDKEQERLDKIIKTRIERERKKFEEQLEKALKEQERLTQLSAEEKEKELKAKYEEELENKAKDIAVRENRLDAIDLFSEAKVPISLVSYVVDVDKDKTIENSQEFIKNYQKSVTETVAEQLKGTPPKDISSNSKQPTKKVVHAF